MVVYGVSKEEYDSQRKGVYKKEERKKERERRAKRKWMLEWSKKREGLLLKGIQMRELCEGDWRI